MLGSDLCDSSDMHFVVKGRINVRATSNTDIEQKDFWLKNNAPFRSCIRKTQQYIYRHCRRFWYSHAEVQSVRI